MRVPRPTTALMSVYAGVATERERELVRQYIEGLITAIAAATQRAEAAEAKLARVDEYGVFCWNNAMAAERDGYCDDDLTFEQWLAKRREAQP